MAVKRPRAVAGWILDKSAAARAHLPDVRDQLAPLAGSLYLCPVGELEQLYSTKSAGDYDLRARQIRDVYLRAEPPVDLLDRALVLQHDLARHHGMWHRLPIPDLLIAETALHLGLGVLHVDRDYDRIAAVRPLIHRRVG
ncbi:PIN domain-containing protein [Sporichthya brevicatena]|uniref:Ribonuclease VapC n=1 Tax=Sporichthya brevicatena TaxID=171442 RepID=A0ABN1HAA6_9ACTN